MHEPPGEQGAPHVPFRQTLPPQLLPAQHGWPMPPQATQSPFLQICPPLQVTPPVFTQLRFPLASHAYVPARHWLRPGLLVHEPPGVHEGRQMLPLHVNALLQALPQQGWLLAPHARQVPLSQI